MTTKTEMLDKILEELESIGGVELSAIVSRQGLLMVSRSNVKSSDSEAFAALTATLHMSAESTTMRLSSEKPKYIIVETDTKHLIIHSAGPDGMIVVLVDSGSYIGLLLNEMKNAANKVKSIL